MLIRFRFSNFRCFRQEQELSLVAAPPQNRPKLVKREEPSVELHRAAAIFGANASGKSSVLAALEFLTEAVLQSHQLWSPQGGVPVPSHALAQDEPSSFEAILFEAGVLYEYEVTLDRTRILYEKLSASRGRKHVLFERSSERAEPFLFGKQLKGENRTIAKLTRDNSLFLSAAAANNHPLLTPVFAWFSKRLQFVASHDRYRQLWSNVYQIKREGSNELGDFLRQADFEIVELRVGDQGRTNLDPMLPRGDLGLELRHRQGGQEFWLPLEKESLGTQAWFAMGGSVLQCLRDGGILCVDELDSSLHPLLVRYLIDLFQDSRRNPKNAQLIFNTHDVSLLGDIPEDSPLDRDQVWITDRGAGGAPELIPLSDFHVRKQENLGRGYLLGRYGGIPRLPLGAA